MVLDTNILIYSAQSGGERLRQWLEDPAAIVSIVSRIEALGFPRITAEEKAAIADALQCVPEAGVTESVAVQAIAPRQERKMALADAIIAATALVYRLPLVTQNVADFKHITGMRLINPFEPLPLGGEA